MAKRGPTPRKLSDEERTGFLELIRSGFGVHLALQKLSIGWARYDRERQRRPAFAREVAAAEACRDEQLVALRYTQALAGDSDALTFMINRADRIQRFRTERRDRRRAAAEATGALDRAFSLPSVVAEAEAIAAAHRAAEPPAERKGE